MRNIKLTSTALLGCLLLFVLLLSGCTPIKQATVVPGPLPETPSTSPTSAQAEESTNQPVTTEATSPSFALDEPIPLTEDLHHGRFENGLSWFLRTNSKPEQRAELRLVINAGSMMEDEDQLGLAHFVEHMAFNGTKNFEKQELVDYLENIGTRFGADLNAYTGFDETVYQLKVPTDDDEIVERAFQILADWATGITFDEEEIDKERGVIVEEWRLGRGAGARLRDKQFPVIFRGSRYAERLPIGDLDIIENGPADALRRFYREWYRPDLMSIIAVGDFDPEHFKGLIKKHFAPIPPAENPRPRETWPVPPHEETLFSLATDPELSSTSVSVLYKHPGESQGTYGDSRRSLVESIYHGMLNSRLDELTQKSDPPFLFAFSSQGSFVRSASVFSQQARVREDQVMSGLKALLTEVERVERHGFTESELERRKISILRGYEQAFRERDKMQSAPLAAELVRHTLEGESVPGIDHELEIAAHFLPTITLDEVNHLAREWITEENRVISVTGPEKEGFTLPTEEELLAAFNEVSEQDIEPYVDQQRDAPLLPEPPTPGSVVDETTIPEVGITEWRLSNGVRVVLKPTDFQNDQVAFTAFSPGGHSLVGDDQHTSALFATSILGEGGLGEFAQIELGKALTGKVAGAQVFLGELEEGATGFASPQDLETMFQLLYLRFTAPRLDEESFASLMARLEILIKNRDSRPGTVYSDRLSEVLSQGHPRRRPISADLLKELDPHIALDIYRQRFANASDFTFIFVGNFQPETLRPLVETYVGGLPGTGDQESWRNIGVEEPEGVVRFEVAKGLEPKSSVDLIFHGPADYSREGLHEIATLAQVLDIRLREVLREDLGATYGVSVGGSLSRRPEESYSISVSFGTAPEEVDGLIEAVFREFEDVKENGIDPENLDKVQETQRRLRESQLKENSFWLQALESYYRYGTDPRLLLTYEDLLAGCTPEHLQAAALRYLNTERYVLGIHHPETPADAQAATPLP